MHDIHTFINRLIRKYGTDNPEDIARTAGIRLMYLNLGKAVYGTYMKYRRCKTIILDCEHTPPHLLPFVTAHELGHALVTPDANTSWLTKNTLAINANIIERRANVFAVNLLLNDEYIEEHREYSLYQLARMRGVPENFVELRCFK